MKYTDARIVAYRLIDEARPQPKLYDFASQSKERNLTGLVGIAATILTTAAFVALVAGHVMPIVNQVEGLLR